MPGSECRTIGSDCGQEVLQTFRFQSDTQESLCSDMAKLSRSWSLCGMLIPGPGTLDITGLEPRNPFPLAQMVELRAWPFAGW